MFGIVHRNGNWYVVSPYYKVYTGTAYGTADAACDAAEGFERTWHHWAEKVRPTDAGIAANKVKLVGFMN
jgi:hypothetical protein